ncbi:quinol oxidase subunit 4 [Adhaeribacter radiodurans]|uniref:Quinol oxidase subunit 4 n=1 Tax=Adhaeribacter radiodurans TaxID=2745197 RepID=A0A7L7L1G6_9BACT|nr:quinol oxidase subunit 4 [Adhaeribacter radiodurans]QMU26627.1 quinol oxidase subunit 4 [Adhaeribacter radiodurans]
MKLKIWFKTFILVVISAVVVCCKTTIVRTSHPGPAVARSLPPGQAKKVYGHQSARAFAPGQQKKQSQRTVMVVKAGKPVKNKKK